MLCILLCYTLLIFIVLYFFTTASTTTASATTTTATTTTAEININYYRKTSLLTTVVLLGLSTRDLVSAPNADRGYGFKDNFASTRPRPDPSSVLCCVTVRAPQCNARSLRAV